MKKLEISISKDGIKVIGDGQELITPKAISITMEGEEEPKPTPLLRTVNPSAYNERIV